MHARDLLPQGKAVQPLSYILELKYATYCSYSHMQYVHFCSRVPPFFWLRSVTNGSQSFSRRVPYYYCFRHASSPRAKEGFGLYRREFR